MKEVAWHSMEPSRLLSELGTDPDQGLAAEEVTRRLGQFGYNELEREERVSPWALFFNQFKNVLIVILLVAIVLSAIVGEVADAVIIAVIVVFCGVLGFVQEYRAERALEALKKMLTPTIRVLRDGKEEEAPSRELVPGDILLLEAGDRIPADARLIENHALRCDEAPLTGESVPVTKDMKPLDPGARVSDRKNMVFTGTTVAFGRGRAVITSTGMNTEFGKIAREVAAVETEKTPLEKRTEEIGKWLGIVALLICLLVACISIAREALGGKIDLPFIVTMLMFAIALAVAAVPEALAAIVTGALAIGMRQMAKNNALVRKMSAVETLGCTTVICSDKTGTLTRGEMTVRKIFLDGRWIEVTGAGYTPVGEFKASRTADAADDEALRLLLRAGLLCSDAGLEEKEGKWCVTGDSTEGALVVAAAKAGLRQAEIRLESPRIEEIPFCSERKRMTTVHLAGDRKRLAFTKGAPEVVLKRCSHILRGSRAEILDPGDKARIFTANEKMAGEALRVLAIAYREVPEEIACVEETVENDLVFLGLVGMMDPPREEAIHATQVCKDVGIKPVMITGDHKLTAMAVAREIGFYQEGDKALTGEELERMPDEEFEKIVDKVTVYARVSPMDKLKIVKAWKKRGEVVAMTGDGVNDAPALKHADIGVAMGISGTDVAREASDMVLSDDNFATIVTAIERGRWIYDNIKKYLTFLIRCNITEVAVIGGVVVISGPDYLPLLPAAILYMNLATDGLPALALGVSPPDPDIMQRPPRDPKESVFSWDVRTFIVLAFVIEIPFFFALFYRNIDDMAHARTEIFFLFIIIELIIALNFSSMRYSIFRVPPNKWLLMAIAWEVALIAVLVQLPYVRDAFGILVPSVRDLATILGFGLIVFVSIEVLKRVIASRTAVRQTGRSFARQA